MNEANGTRLGSSYTYILPEKAVAGTAFW